jgi:hypothetical protein
MAASSFTHSRYFVDDSSSLLRITTNFEAALRARPIPSEN